MVNVSLTDLRVINPQQIRHPESRNKQVSVEGGGCVSTLIRILGLENG